MHFEMKKTEILSAVQNVDLCYNNCKLITVDKCDITYNDFFNNFMIRNLPCLIKNVSLPWESTNNWIKDNKINHDYFLEVYGDLEAPVADCESINFNAHNKINMKVKDYFNYLKNGERDKLLYLKDWHLKRLRPNDNFYTVPQIFASDWLNEFAKDHGDDDFMFVYIGSQNSWTPFHADVYSSYSWSVNVIGKKKWLLFPPGEEDKIKDQLGNYPLFFIDCKDKNPNVKYFEVIQETGDALFVPSGWHHQVLNIVDTISINHNWVNGCNIEQVWASLQNNLASVENEIEELRDTEEFTDQCQLILKSIFGMDFNMFITFVTYIGKKRLSQLKGENVGSNVELGNNHILFDLKMVLKIMCLIQDHPLVLNSTLPPYIKIYFTDTKSLISDYIKLH